MAKYKSLPNRQDSVSRVLFSPFTVIVNRSFRTRSVFSSIPRASSVDCPSSIEKDELPTSSIYSLGMPNSFVIHSSMDFRQVWGEQYNVKTANSESTVISIPSSSAGKKLATIFLRKTSS